MQAVDYVGKVLPDGHLELPPSVREEWDLHPEMEVKISLRWEEGGSHSSQCAQRATRRHDAIQALLTLREEFAGMAEFSLTDEVVRMREEEDL